MQRSDTRVFHEVYSNAYYFGVDRISKAFARNPPDPILSFASVTREITDDYPQDITFIKDFAYALAGRMEQSLLAKFKNTFIIRNPEESIPSLFRMSNLLSEDFEPVEAGFLHLGELFRIVTKELQQPPIVVDADDLRRKPKEILEAYCKAIGIDFDQRMLNWEPGSVKTWDRWKKWHVDAENSTGFYLPKQEKQPVPDSLISIIEASRPIYEALHAIRLAV